VTIQYHNVAIDGINIFYREAGPKDAPVLLMLHGFPSSSHMFRDLIPQLSDQFRIIAPDYPGFGYSDAPAVDEFEYTFDNLTQIIEKLIVSLRLKKFSLLMQDYGGPIGFRIASQRPERIQALIVQNANAYVEGISAAFNPIKPFWENRNDETETPVRALFTKEMTKFQYTYGASNPDKICPDSWHHDQALLDKPGNDLIQLALLHDYPSNVGLYEEWQAYFRRVQPPTLVVSGKNDPFFTPAGQEAFKRDIKQAEVHLFDGGHFVLEEYHIAIATIISTFLFNQLG